VLFANSSAGNAQTVPAHDASVNDASMAKLSKLYSLNLIVSFSEACTGGWCVSDLMFESVPLHAEVERYSVL
jgi:hypothetical protein